MIRNSVLRTNSWWAQTRRPILFALIGRFSTFPTLCTSISPPKASYADRECDDFLPWLEHKAGAEISSSLCIGKSSHGRALYASEYIQTGDCLLKVPYCVQLAPDNLPPRITRLLGDEVSNVAKVALLILREKKLGHKSEWYPYISRLPEPEDLHSTIFWSNEELEMIRPSATYEETIKQQTRIENDFLTVKLAIDLFPEHFGDVTMQDFAYAYGLVTSRAWESSRSVSMIPFADFLNHDGTSESCVLSDEGKKHSEVIADRDFAPGDEVLIRYGKFSNATLLLDFGFTVPCNRYDQVRIDLDVPKSDRLYSQKLEILDRHRTRNVKDVNEFTSSANSFMIKEVRNGSRKGKGIPQSVRAFARVMTCSSEQQLNALVIEAAQNDGRLARRPLENRDTEMAAHLLLLSEISELIEERDRCLNLLAPAPDLFGKGVLRRQLAQDLMSGELRVLKSASTWLKNYCSILRTN